jgi:hypothetical protein
VPIHISGPGAAITQRQRLDLLRRCATDNTITLSTRVAGALLLLYAQPLTRIGVLTIDDVTTDPTGAVHIGLGEPATPVPQPFADLLLDLTANRDNLHIATNAASRWLFPGRLAGQPAHYMTLRHRLASAEFPSGLIRIGALRQLVLQIPAPVAAASLGYHRTTAHRQAVNAGATWNRYPAPSLNAARPARPPS